MEVNMLAFSSFLEEILKSITLLRLGMFMIFFIVLTLSIFCLPVLALAVVPVISVAVRQFGRYLRELSHKTQAAAAVASSIAEVSLYHFNLVWGFMLHIVLTHNPCPLDH